MILYLMVKANIVEIPVLKQNFRKAHNISSVFVLLGESDK